MLRLSYVPRGEAGEIVKKFVNDRLIDIMEDVFVEHLVCGKKWGESPKTRDDYVAMLDEGKLDELRTDPLFMDIIASDYAPCNSPKERTCSEFISLYKLLKNPLLHSVEILAMISASYGGGADGDAERYNRT